jgi:hypothetical protein
MDESADPTTFGSRNASFMTGRFGPAPSPGLVQTQEKQSYSTPGAYRASGANQQITLSGNGNSTTDASRRTYSGSYLPTSNGISANTYEQKRPLLSPSLSVN